MDIAYVKLALAALMPVALAGVFYLLDRKTPFGKIKYIVKQIIFGVLFGALAIIGTEWGIPLNGAQVNCRDAAVLTAGLLFGGPAGIIAGLIGGIERWIAVAWGVGTFTRVACSVSTILAGFYAAALRKHMFEDKKPGWLLSFAVGIVMEVFHLTMVFLTNMATPEKAMAVVKACSVPMIIANGFSVLFATIFITLLAREHLFSHHESVRISQTVQRWLFLSVAVAFALTSFFVYRLQDTMSTTQTDSLLSLAIADVAADIDDASDSNLLNIARLVKVQLGRRPLKEIAEDYNVAEISLINTNGIIYESSEPQYIGFDMASGSQSSAFLCLLDNNLTFVQEFGSITSDRDVARKYAGIKTDFGFLQVGYDAQELQEDLDTQVQGITKNRHVGATGFLFIVDRDNKVVSAPISANLTALTRALAAAGDVPQDTTYRTTIDGQDVFCRYHTTEGYSIVSVLPVAEAQQLRNIALYVNTFMEILVFALMFGMIYQLIKRVVVNRIKSINHSLAKITGGNLNEVVNVRDSEEFAHLSDDINSTVETLKRYIAEASARIDAELEFAKTIQSSALPHTFPKRKDFEIYARMDTAKEVGGDFYDFYLTDENTLHFLIADVSGKGIPAAMFMMRAKAELKSLAEMGLSLDEVFLRGNNALCDGNDAGMFVTVWQGCLDLKTGLVRFVSAGHNPPLVRHGDGSFDYLRTRPGFVLGGMEDAPYRVQECTLAPGDSIYLYTDGVTEATDAENRLFGEERLLQAVNAKEYGDMHELCDAVKADVDAFVGDAPQFDDITMLALHYTGQKPAPSIRFDAATLEDITAVTEFVENELEKLDCPMKTVIQFNVAVDEIFSNIVRYGYPKGPGPITVSVVERDDPHRVYLRFADEGIPYNPLTKVDPDVTLSAEEREIGGLGIFMVKKTMDDMKYKYEKDQNILSIMKLL